MDPNDSSSTDDATITPVEVVMWTLRVSGLGQNLTVQVPSSSSIATLKACIAAKATDWIPAEYQRLIARGIKMDGMEDCTTLADAGLQDRTKVILLHNA